MCVCVCVRERESVCVDRSPGVAHLGPPLSLPALPPGSGGGSQPRPEHCPGH